MRKVGLFLGLLGGFLVMLAILAKFYAPGQLMRTPVDVDSTTYLSGEAALGSDPAAPVKATSITKADSEKSTSDVVVFVNSSCLVLDEGDVPNCVSADDPQERLISASVDNFATDRKTAVAVNDDDLLPPDAEPYEGLVNKWPFDAEKKTYPYWDGLLGEAVDAVYSGEATLDGLKTYKYQVTVTDEPAEISSGVQGTYSDDKTIYIDPVTGSIIHQVEHQERTDDEGDNFLTLDLEFTPEQVESNAADADANGSRLGLVRGTVPLVGLLVGIPALVAGVFLSLRARRDPHEHAA